MTDEHDHEHEPDAQAAAEQAAPQAQAFPLQMPYRMITPQDQHTMITERVAALEREHFSKQLLMWENAGRPDIEAALAADMAEIQRRIELHIGAPTPPPQLQDSESEQQDGEQDQDAQAAGDPALNGAGGGPNRAARRAARR